DSKDSMYNLIFEGGNSKMIFMEDLDKPYLNYTIGFLEPREWDNPYFYKPSQIIHNNIFDDKLVIDSIAEHLADSSKIFLQFSYIYNDESFNGYVAIDSASFYQNFLKLNLTYYFMCNESFDKFVYYRWEVETNELYIYKGIIENDRF